jgi:hypothetical protein
VLLRANDTRAQIPWGAHETLSYFQSFDVRRVSIDLAIEHCCQPANGQHYEPTKITQFARTLSRFKEQPESSAVASKDKCSGQIAPGVKKQSQSAAATTENKLTKAT